MLCIQLFLIRGASKQKSKVLVEITLVMMNGCGIVSLDWQSSAEGETILQHFYDPQTTGRKVLGTYVCIYVYMFCTT